MMHTPQPKEIGNANKFKALSLISLNSLFLVIRHRSIGHNFQRKPC